MQAFIGYMFQHSSSVVLIMGDLMLQLNSPVLRRFDHILTTTANRRLSADIFEIVTMATVN